ncbi:TPA: hypothetical protein JD178_21680 [Cronobacter sakazakii]|nr:hypothetical protein [Cronobacter sakazakii]
MICSPVLGIAAGEGCCREVRSWCCIGVGVSQIHPTRHWCLLFGVASENGIYGHSRFCNTDFDDKLACLNLSGV